MKKNSLQLGCGLIRIGRLWGVEQKPVPTETEVRTFLESAFDLGIRMFDTAPSYGSSEKRLGEFLKSLTSSQRKEVFVATKFSEHWDYSEEKPFVDYDLEVLKKSLNMSLSILGNINLIQLHKATPENIADEQIINAFRHASSLGVEYWGASVSDVDTGLAVLKDERYSYLQLPYNYEREELLSIIRMSVKSGRKLIFNRPFAMGSLLNGVNSSKHELIEKAFQFILKTGATGYILTGTASPHHLSQNHKLFLKVANE